MKKYLTIYFLFITICSYSQQWQNLFDGKSLKGWNRYTGSAIYKVENGAITGTTVANSPNSFLVCKRKFTGDFILEMEAMMSDSNTNSGVQFRSNLDATAYEGNWKVYGYQYEFDPSARRWTGGIYDEGRREWLYPVSLNNKAQVYFTPGVYHKIRIECIGNAIKTWLDGKAVSYLIDTLITNEGLIGLQVHSVNKAENAGNKIYWKNIRIQTGKITPSSFDNGIYVVNLKPNTLSDYEKKNGWRLLFDGVSSKGWKGAYKDSFPSKGWVIKDGNLTVLSSNGAESTNGGDIVTKEKFSAFDLSFEFKITPGANSGVKYFVTLNEHNSGSAIGLEYQVLDDTLHPDAKLGRDGNRTMASLYDLIKAEKSKRFIRQPGGWNIGRIIVYPNNHVEHYLNGVKVLEYERGSQAFRDLVAMSKYKIWQNFGEAKEGFILLQDHGNEVSYRSIKIKKL
ncbi:MAG: DUF1080 domain-containing protein [Sphingobacteriales bacterium]|nr:DUF1080 domain-containing protein [Sphingobacteriales bacterium]MBI3718544.1 DUF1080 domain-containing protein [Sphingobacteriales bacterium]